MDDVRLAFEATQYSEFSTWSEQKQIQFATYLCSGVMLSLWCGITHFPCMDKCQKVFKLLTIQILHFKGALFPILVTQCVSVQRGTFAFIDNGFTDTPESISLF